jgi:hypothetical protein
MDYYGLECEKLMPRSSSCITPRAVQVRGTIASGVRLVPADPSLRTNHKELNVRI